MVTDTPADGTGRTGAGRPAVGWVGLGDQGLPMATAIARAGFPLHVWARRPTSLAGWATSNTCAKVNTRAHLERTENAKRRRDPPAVFQHVFRHGRHRRVPVPCKSCR